MSATEAIDAVVLAVCDRLAVVPSSVRRDIAVAQLSVAEADGDPRRPELELAYDTRVHQERLSQQDEPDRALELRYFSGAWVDAGEVVTGEVWDRAFQAEGRRAGLWYDDDLWLRDEDRAIELAVELHDLMVEILRRGIRTLHADGVLVELIGRSVLVLGYPGDDNDTWDRFTLEDNPPDVHGEFAAWAQLFGPGEEP